MRTLILCILGLLAGEAYAQVVAPKCYPDLVFPAKVRTAEIPAGVSEGHDRIATWACSSPTGYSNEVWMFTWATIADQALNAIRGVFDEQAARARCARDCRPLTDSERAFALQWSAQFRLRASVQASGTATSRPVYGLGPTGQLVLTPLPDQRVAAGAPCWIGRKIGQSFFSVQGQPNVATPDPEDTLGEVFAVCAVVAPLGVNL